MKVWLITFLAILGIANCKDVKTIFSWETLNFEYPNSTTPYENGDYIPINNAPSGLAVWKNKLFITVDRRNGVVSNLHYISLEDINSSESPNLIPYPSLESNDISNPSDNTIANIIKPKVDSCNRLWGLDNGVKESKTQKAIPPRLIVINLETDKIIRTYALKDSDVKHNSSFSNIVIDEDEKSCDKTFVYILDTFSYGLVVYSWAENKSWRVDHDSFKPDSRDDIYYLLGLRYEIFGGISSGFLSKAKDDGSKTLYFHALSSTTEFAVSNRILQDETMATMNNNHTFLKVGSRGPLTQSIISVLDTNTDIAYFMRSNRQSLVCWNTHLSLNPKSFHTVLNYEDRVEPINDKDVTISQETNTLYILSVNVATPIYGIMFIKNHFITAVPLDDISKHCHQNSSGTFTWPEMFTFE